MRAFFLRTVPIWEGHVREGLSKLAEKLEADNGNAIKITEAAVDFVQYVAKGFSPSVYGKALLQEVRNGCTARRKLMPAKLQNLGRTLLEEPNQRGVAKFLTSLEELARTDSDFGKVEIDCRREFWDAVRLGDFESPTEGFAEISRRRSSMGQSIPPKALSTIHKAKGLESGNVLIIPCDKAHFGDSPAARCGLYVAMSRATRLLTVVVSRESQSPLITV
jgi:DNA helicase-2/ATP-dependent DNA helicase PcrA